MDELVCRPVTAGEREEALALWDSVFGPGRDYFERYFAVDPWYREGDCLGIRGAGRLVSAVHVCRRPVAWRGGTAWCGAIANVATLPEHRRQGHSRALLRAAIALMEGDGLAFSMLFTGSHGHYGALGWEQVRTPRPTVVLEASPAAAGAEIRGPDAEEARALYAACAAPPLLLQRPARYFEGWAAWNWRQWRTETLVVPGRGYAALAVPPGEDRPARLVEWRAADGDAEGALLRAAAARARERGKTRLILEGLPFHGGIAALEEIGAVEARTSGSMMLRNLALPEAEYREIGRLYAAGEAAWWPADGF